jgi:quercetin dioxygenase-like cupin family protein
MTDDTLRDYFRTADHATNPEAFPPSLGPRSDYPVYDISDGIRFQPVWGRNLLLNWVHFEPNRELPDHSHPEEQMGTIISGEIELTIGGVTQVLREGDVYVIPPNVRHAGHTFEQRCVALDIFSPPRSDFRDLIARAEAAMKAGRATP